MACVASCFYAPGMHIFSTDALVDRVAMVTGASRGMGRAIALRLAGHGCSVMHCFLVLYAVGSPAWGDMVPAHSGAGAPLSVTVRGLRSDDGVGYFSLYDTASAYDAKSPRVTASVATTNGVCAWRLPELPAGNYAVRFFLDENANGVLDRNTIGIPREPVAFSNGARPRFGPPRYSQMEFPHGDIESRQTIDAFSVLGRRGRVGLGVGVIVKQSPYGPDDARIVAIPMISYIGDRLIVAGPRVSYQVASSARTRSALLLQYQFDGFDKDEYDQLAGMHPRGDTVMAGVSSAYDPTENVQISGQLLGDILDEHGGWRGTLRVGRKFSMRDLSLEPGLGIEWISSHAANHYYGVSATEATSVRPAYAVGDAININVRLGVRYTLSEAVSLFGSMEQAWLDRDIRHSPIVTQDSLFSLFLALAYAL
jgi:outer membrane protein